MGLVYRAMHLALRREVALKVISPELSADPDFRERFQSECQAAAAIDHPHVIPIYDAGDADGRLYLTMRLVDGVDLARLLAVRERLEPIEAARLVAQLGGALDAAHRLGLVHRDIKPANVLLEDGGADGPQALLTDFGLSKRMQESREITQVGVFVGTIDYAAPEQLRGGTIDARTDVYALGCVLYHALTGRVPYPGDNDAVKIFAHVEAPPPPLVALVPGVPQALEEVVHCAMAKERERRYPSAGALGQAALAAVGLRSVAGPDGAREPRSGAQSDLDTPIPMPPALVLETGGQPFVGRSAARATLRRRYAQACTGERQFVLLCGEPGVGKTRLAAEFGREVHAQGALVLYGRSDAESLVPYQPFIAAVQHRVSYRRRLEFPDELAPEMSELSRFLPALRSQVPARDAIAQDPEARRFRLFEAMARVVAFAAREQPMVLILDDLQWADTSTSLLLNHVLHDPEPVALLVVGTTRDRAHMRAEELTQLLARLRRQPMYERIELGGLDLEETEALVTATERREVTESFVTRLREQTDGNPLFIGEMLRSLAETDHDAGDAVLDADLDQLAVPEGVKEVIGQRLARLSETANQVLTVAAVAGREVRLQVLEALIDEPPERIIVALEEAIAAGLVREVVEDVDRFAFSHALVRETLYEDQIAARRVRLHDRISRVLEELSASMRVPPAEIAHHCLESRHLDREGRAIDYSLAAARQASQALAYEEAVAHLRRALDALDAGGSPDAVRYCDVLLELGEVEARAGLPAARETFARAARLARAEGLGEQLGRAALGFAGRHTETGVVDPQGIALLEEAVAKLAGRETPLEARLLARLAGSLRYSASQERTLALSAAAVDLARRLDATEALVTALESRHAVLLHIEYLPDRLRLGEELLALAERTGERELEALGRHWRIFDLLEAGEVEAAREQHRTLTRLADQLRQALYQHFAVAWSVVWAQMAGEMVEAERLARRAYEIGRRAHVRDADTIYATQLLILRRREDRLPEFVSTVEDLVAKHPSLVAWRTVLPLMLAGGGEREAAVREFERFAAGEFAELPRNVLWFPAMCILSEACSLIGDAERAATLYAKLVPYRSRNVQVVQAACFGSAERFLALLARARGEFALASEHFEAAIRLNVARGVLSNVPLIRREYAEVLVEQNELDRATEQLRASLEGAEAAGMSKIAASVRRRIDELVQLHSAVAELPPATS
jgi:tetratricopeptide (TPR) repeat protein